MCCCSCWPPAPLEGAHDGEQKWGTFCSPKPGRTGLQIVRYSQELIFWAQFLYLLVSRKALKSFMVMTVSHDRQKRHETSRNFLKNKHAWLHVLPLHQNWMYTVLLLLSLEQSLRAVWGAVSWAAVLILPQIKLLTHDSDVRFFKVDSTIKLNSNKSV